MAEFTSSPQVSPTPNQLFQPLLAGQQQAQQNQLQMQQIDLSAADHEQVGRLAAGLLNEPDLGKRADLYSRGVGMLQSQNLAKYAPPTLPDESTLRSLVSQTIPAQTQAEWLQNLTANKAYTNAGNTASTTAPGSTTGTGVATTPSATIEPAAFNNATAVRDGLIKRGIDADTATAFAANALHESVANPATGRGDNGNSAGLFQWAGPRLQAYTDAYGHSPDGSPLDEQLDNVVRELKGSEAPAAAKIAEAQGPAAKAAAVSQYYLRPKDTVPEMQRRSATALQLQQQIGGGATTASAAPSTAQPGQPVPTQVAGPPMVSTAPPGSTVAPGGSTAAAPAPQATPAGSPAPPQLQPVNANGLTDVQQRQVNALAANPQTTLPQRMAAEQAFRNQNIQLQQKQFSDWVQVQQLQTSQGQLSVSQQNSALEYWKAAHPDAKVTMTGGEIITQDPRNGQEIAPRIQVTPQRADTAAMAIVSRLGPKVANGSATPEEQAQYAVAVDSYRQPVLRENPLTKETVRVNTRELPTGFPEPPSLGGSAAPGGTSAPGGPQTVLPGMSLAQQNVEPELGKAYATTDKKSYDTANASLGMLVNANNAAEVLNRNPGGFTATGSGANTRLELGKTLNTVSGLFGGGPVVDPSQISAWEALNKQTRLMGMQVVNSYFGGSREAASIINGATSAVPNSENSYLGFRLVSSGIEQDLLRQRELYEFKGQQLKDGKPLATAEAEFNKANPVQTYTARAIANAVPDDIAAHLVANPDTVRAFDQHFGPGIGEFILKGGRTGMGRAGVPSNG